MYRRALRSAVAAASCAGAVVLVLAGCSSQPAQPMATLGGSPAGTGAGVAVTVAPPTVGATLPPDFKVDFTLTVTGTPTQVQLLTQAKALILAYEQAVERNDPKDPLYQGMVTGLGATNLAASITSYKTAKERPTGTLVFYQFTTKVNTVAADVLFCENRAQVTMANFKTGAAMTNPDTGKQHWDIGFDHESDGTWKIAYVSALTVTAGSSQCT